MCRIAGIYQGGSPIDIISKQVRQLCDLQQHGGPDDEGLFAAADHHLVLGNRRLSLLDLSPAGHMPMHYCGRFTITYNGELYNFSDLKAELHSLGHIFSNHTDTEVIVAAFAEWHTQAFCKFKGMFAFAIWDNQEKELFLCRDAVGIKPLYYFLGDNMLAFASEVRALKSLSSLQDKDTNWPVYLMAYGHIPEPATTLSQVRPLPKGCFLKYKLETGLSSIQSFSHFSFSHSLADSAESKKEVRETMELAVQRHLVADAPLGVFLSGGLDSSIIAWIASQYKKTSLNTLSIYFEEPEYSEKKYQDLIQQRLQCDHHQHLLREVEFQESFEQILDSMDMPTCDGVNTWFISKHAASLGLKAVLSGVGGDELFGGYPSFNRISTALMLQRMPAFVTSAGKNSSAKRLNRMAYLNMEGIKGIYLFLRGHFSAGEIARHLGMYEKDVWRILNDQPVFNDISGIDNKNQASWMELNMYMQNQLLRDADVMGMIHGVEIRVPFLDEDVVRLAHKIAPEVKFEGPKAKQLLINSFKDILPQEIWDRPKMGFSFPFAKWLSSSQYVEQLVQSGNVRTKQSFAKFKRGELHWSHMMSLIILSKKGLN